MDKERLGDLVVVFVIISVIVAVTFGCGVFATYISGDTTCSEFASQNPQYQFKYTFWNGCLVRTPNGVWLSASKMNWVNGEIKIEP